MIIKLLQPSKKLLSTPLAFNRRCKQIKNAKFQEAPEDEGEDDDKNEVFMVSNKAVSNKVALESIRNLHNYLQQNNDIKVNSLLVSGLRDLKWEIVKKRTDPSSMDIY